MNKSRAFWAILLFLYAGAIFAMSSFPMVPEEPLVPIPHGDKLLHGVEYSVFFFLCWKVLPPQRRTLYSLILTAAYAGSDEFHQLFVFQRSASILDWLFDLAGALVAAFLIRLFLHLPLLKGSSTRILVASDPDKEA